MDLPGWNQENLRSQARLAPCRMEIQLAIIDDDQEFLSAFCDYASRTVGFSLPAAYTSPTAALRDIQKSQFDVIIVDLLIGRSSGCDLIQNIRELRVDAKVFVLSAFSDDHLVSEAFRLGADGYLLKTTPIKEILNSIRNYFSGGVAIDSIVMNKVLNQLRAPTQENSLELSLTPRERSVLKQLSTGRNYKEIAQSLSVSPETIYSHSKRLFRKLGVKSKTEAVVCYLAAQRQEKSTEPHPPE